VKASLAKEAPGKDSNGKSTPAQATPEENGAKNDASDDDDWDPERPAVDAVNDTANDSEDEWNPEQPSEPIAAPTEAALAPAAVAEDVPASNGTPLSSLPPVEFGNELFTVRLPRAQPLVSKPLPRDGIFRPPFGWKYHYSLQEAVDAPEFIVPWEAFRALAEEYGLELLYKKGFREVYEDESEDRELGMLAERMGVRSRDRSGPNGGRLVGEDEMEAAAFYLAFTFYKS
jgi:mRNA (guanine-N7-)-methyltransferase